MSIGWNVNITPTERSVRILLGLLATAGGAFLLASSGSPVAVVLELLLILAGLDLVVTGTTGHCPLYKTLGHVPGIAQGDDSMTDDMPHTDHGMQTQTPSRGKEVTRHGDNGASHR